MSFNARRAHLADAIKYSIAGHEIEWLPSGGPGGALGCQLWPMNPEDFDLSKGRVRLNIGAAGGTNFVELPPDKFLIHRLRVGLMEPSSILYRHDYLTRRQATAAIFNYIEIFYNRQRRHSALGYLSPEAFEATMN